MLQFLTDLVEHPLRQPPPGTSLAAGPARASMMASLRRSRRPRAMPAAVIVHKLPAQLRDRASGAPLGGFTIHTFDLDAPGAPKSLGYTTTDAEGMFLIAYTTTTSSARARC
jgi:hypothetical protein